MVRFDRFNGDRGRAWAALAAMGNEVHASAALSTDQPIFSQVAVEQSHGFTAAKGGLHDWTTRGALVAEDVDKVLFSLPIGQMSTILTGPSGFHIVRVLERQPAGRTPFTEAQAAIRLQLQQQRVRAQAEKYVVGLRKKAQIWTVFTGEISADEIAQARP